MGCGGTKVRSVKTAQRAVVFSKGGTAPAENDIFVFWPSSLIPVAPQVEGVRASIKVENAMADLTTQLVFQTTSDGKTWGDGSTPGAVVALEASPVTGNRVATSSWYTDQSKFLLGIRFGVIAGQAAGSDAAFGKVSIAVDLNIRS